MRQCFLFLLVVFLSLHVLTRQCAAETWMRSLSSSSSTQHDYNNDGGIYESPQSSSVSSPRPESSSSSSTPASKSSMFLRRRKIGTDEDSEYDPLENEPEEDPSDSFLQGDVCDYLSQEDCDTLNGNLLMRASKTRAYASSTSPPSSSFSRTSTRPSDPGKGKFDTFFSASSGRNHLPGTASATISTATADTVSSSSTNTTTKVLVVLLVWSNHENKTNLIPVEIIDELFNSNTTDTFWYPSGSVSDYIYKNSHGHVQIEAHVTNWAMTNGTEYYYADGRSGKPSRNDQPELRQALYYVMDQLDAEGFPFDEFDLDGDGEIDYIIFLHSGYGSEYGGVDCENPDPSKATYEHRISSHAVGDWRENKWTSSDGSGNTQLGAYAIATAYRGNCGGQIARLGILTHELLHTFGLPDLYDVDGKIGNSVGGLAGFDIMGNPRGPRFRQAWPGMLSPWSKMDMGWVTPIQISESGTYLARPSELYPDIYIIRLGYEEGEYLLIENRQPISYDSLLWSGGCLIYHIDETSPIQGNDNRGYPGQLWWPSSGRHYPVAMLQADGLYQLERGASNGDVGDFYRDFDQRIGPGNGEAVASDAGTYPNTDSYVDGIIKLTGIVIDQFQPVGTDGDWSFRVTFPPTTASPTSAPTEPCEHWFDLELVTDRFGDETSFELTTALDGQILLADGDHRDDPRNQQEFDDRTTYTYHRCLPDEEDFFFTMYDRYFDGICCASYQGQGSYTVWMDGEIVASGGDYTTSETTMFSTKTASSDRIFGRIPGRPNKFESSTTTATKMIEKTIEVEEEEHTTNDGNDED